jgi:hypothetical protein
MAEISSTLDRVIEPEMEGGAAMAPSARPASSIGQRSERSDRSQRQGGSSQQHQRGGLIGLGDIDQVRCDRHLQSQQR